MLILTFFLLLFIYLWLKLTKICNYWKDRGVKYVKPLPFFGNSFGLMTKKITTAEFIQMLYQAYPEERYCGVFQLINPVLLIRDPDLIKQVTVKNFENFVDHSESMTVDSDPMWSKNLFASKGTKWRDLRHTLSPAFTGSKMRLMFSFIDSCAKQVVDHFKTKNADLFDVEMKDLSQRFANDVIATTSFGIQVDSLKSNDNEFLTYGRDMVDNTGLKRFGFIIYGLFPRLSKLFGLKLITNQNAKFFTSIITETIRVRRENNIVRPDLIYLLMEARKGRLEYDEDPDQDSGYASPQVPSSKILELTDHDIVAQAVNFFIGGFDPTSSLMALVAHELAVNPSVQSRLRRDILETLEQNGGIVTYDSLMQMKYMDMVVNETLRKWPPAFFLDRRCNKSFQIEPVRPGEKVLQVEVGTTVWVPAYALHHDPQYYPEPEQFDPERFDDDNKFKIEPFTFLPFGLGPRNCIGNRFALLETKVLIFHLLSQFELVPNSKTQIPLKISKNSFTFMADSGFYLSLKQLPSA